MAYEYDSKLYLLDTKLGKDTPLEIRVPADSRVNPRSDITVATSETFEVSPDGRRMVIASRGDLFLTLERGGPTRRLTTNPALDTQPTWLDKDPAKDAKRVLMTTDAQGKTAVWQDAPGDLSHPRLSPDGKLVLFQEGDNRLMIRSVAKDDARQLVRANLRSALDGSPRYSWSPDSKYVAVDKIQGRRREVVLIEVATGKQTPVARLVFKPQTDEGVAPIFLPNGRGLLVFSGEYEKQDLFLVDLVPPETTFTEDELDRAEPARSTATPKPAEIPPVQILESGIFQRLRRLTTDGAREAAVDGRTIYVATGAGIVTINPATGAATPFLPNPNASDLVVKNGKLYFSEANKLFSVTLAGPPAATPIPFTITFSVDNRAEQEALFADIWWAIDRLYYDPKLNGKDWPAIRARYAQKVPSAFDRQEFYRIMGEMMEELDSSHLGATPPPAEPMGLGSESPAFLGIDLDPVRLATGDYVVGRVIPGSAATLPASALMTGDRILEVDGTAPSDATPLSSLLNRKAG
ncbi:MAG: hypothetical protein C4320_05185, partial [Armatimonadota bacterium]